jgi:hypothetical protein
MTMMRRVVMGLLILGTIVGFGSGIARRVHGHHRNHDRFMDRVADECVDAARRADRRERDTRLRDFRDDRPDPR